MIVKTVPSARQIALLKPPAASPPATAPCAPPGLLSATASLHVGHADAVVATSATRTGTKRRIDMAGMLRGLRRRPQVIGHDVDRDARHGDVHPDRQRPPRE